MGISEPQLTSEVLCWGPDDFPLSGAPLPLLLLHREKCVTASGPAGLAVEPRPPAGASGRDCLTRAPTVGGGNWMQQLGRQFPAAPQQITREGSAFKPQPCGFSPGLHQGPSRPAGLSGLGGGGPRPRLPARRCGRPRSLTPWASPQDRPPPGVGPSEPRARVATPRAEAEGSL